MPGFPPTAGDSPDWSYGSPIWSDVGRSFRPSSIATAAFRCIASAKCSFRERPIKVDVLKKWIGMRLLKTQRAGRARIVTAEEVERFRKTYCLADEACRSLGVHRTTLSRWEVEGRIRPVYGKRIMPGAGFSLYRHEDIERRKPPESDHSMPDARAA